MTRDDFLNCCADRIQALINSKVASPTRDELKAALDNILKQGEGPYYEWTGTSLLIDGILDHGAARPLAIRR